MTHAFATLARLSVGVVVWAVHFAVVYGSTALACARAHAPIGEAAIIVATVGAAVLAAAFGIHEWRRRERFESWLAATIAALALVAIVFEGITMLMVPRCG